jgi:hypothetical protein
LELAVQADPEVSRRKFENEVARLLEQRSALESRGILLLQSTAYPIVECLFVPRNPLRVPVSATQAGKILLPPGAMMALDVPNVAGRAFKTRFDLSDYDLRAPSLQFWDPWRDEPLLFKDMFRALEYEKERKAHVVLLDDHPVFHRPFLCIRGIREYHEHPQHTGDEWLLYRKHMSLFSIIMSVWRVTVDLIRPVLFIQPNRLQVQWQAEEKD